MRMKEKNRKARLSRMQVREEERQSERKNILRIMKGNWHGMHFIDF